MPLKEGKSQKTFSSNVEELVHKFKQKAKKAMGQREAWIIIEKIREVNHGKTTFN